MSDRENTPVRGSEPIAGKVNEEPVANQPDGAMSPWHRGIGLGHGQVSRVVGLVVFGFLLGLLSVAARGASDGDLRIEDGPSGSHGRLEIFHDGEWGGVCDDDFDDTDAGVACRELGYTWGVDSTSSLYLLLPSEMSFWLANVACTGSESHLTECAHPGWGGYQCRDFEAATVSCHGAQGTSSVEPSPDTTDTTAPTLSTAAVTSRALTLTFDEALNESSDLAPNVFNVKVSASSGAQRRVKVSSGSISGSVATLTLAEAIIASETVTVSYTRPSPDPLPTSDPLEDAAGNDVASVTDRTVTNHSPACPGEVSNAFWKACMRIGRAHRTKPVYGYGYHHKPRDFIGSLSPATFRIGGDSHRVNSLYHNPVLARRGTLVMGFGSQVPPEVAGRWSLHLSGTGTLRFSDGEFLFRNGSWGGGVWGWRRGSMGWSEGDAVTVALSSPDVDTAPQAPQALEARPGDREVTLSWTAPESVNAVTGYEYRLCAQTSPTQCAYGPWHPTDSAETEYTVQHRTLEQDGTTHRFRLVNGTTYRFQVRALAGEVVGAVSSEVEAVPAAPALVTASFPDAPASHDGLTTFSFELRFSEDLPGLSYRTLRDSAFTVTNGRVTRAVRLQTQDAERNRRWRITVEPSASESISISLAATGDCAAAGAICTADGRTLEAALLTVAFEAAEPRETPRTAALTATFVGLPAEHDGSSAFDFELRLSESPPRLSYRTLQGAAFAVTNGRVTRAARLQKRGDDKNRRWEITVAPDGYGDVTVALPETTDCAASGAICGAEGKKLSTAVSGTVQGPPAAAVADARAQEGTDATLDFQVTLGRAPAGTVTVDYATADGTALSGEDYTETSGTLTFASGETSKTVSVPVLDDAHDEGEETLTLRLSNAAGAWIEDGEAVGTIVNSDPIPKAWLARFGRTVTGQVLDAVEARLAAPRTAGAQASLAGQALPSRRADEVAAANPGSGTGAGDDAAGATALRADAEDRAALAAMGAWLAQAGSDGRGTSGYDAHDGGGTRFETRALTGRDFVTGTSFNLTGGSAQRGGFASLWGRGALTSFDGREGDLTVDGEVSTGFLGADWASEQWTAGLALGHSRGSGGYREGGVCGDNDHCAGDIEAMLNGLYPYAGIELTERLSVWAVAGYGTGEVTVTPQTPEGRNRTPMSADLTLSMGAAGLRNEVFRAESDGGFDLAVKGDARFARTSSEAVRTPARGPGQASSGNLEAADADVWLVQVGIEGSRRFALGRVEDGASVTPSFELGVRRDGGDAETGFGADFGGGVAFADARHGLSFDTQARGLIAHEADGFREWGAAISFGWDAQPSSDRGFSVSLRQSWGASSSGGMDALLSRETLAGLAAGDNGASTEAASRLEAELGYGLPVFGGAFTGTPHVGIALADTGRDYRLGWRLTAARRDALGFALDLEGTRSESAGGDESPEHAVMLRGSLRW